MIFNFSIKNVNKNISIKINAICNLKIWNVKKFGRRQLHHFRRMELNGFLRQTIKMSTSKIQEVILNIQLNRILLLNFAIER